MLLLTIGSMNEFYRIARLKQVTPLRLYPIIIGAGIVITSFFVATGAASPRVFAWALPAVFALFIVGLYDKNDTHVENIVWEIGGIVYIAVPMALLTALSIWNNHIYAVDPSQYSIHRMGQRRRRLSDRSGIRPSKTVRTYLSEQIMGRLFRRCRMCHSCRWNMRLCFSPQSELYPHLGWSWSRYRYQRSLWRPDRIHAQTFGRNQRFRKHSSGTRRLSRPI